MNLVSHASNSMFITMYKICLNYLRMPFNEVVDFTLLISLLSDEFLMDIPIHIIVSGNTFISHSVKFPYSRKRRQ